MSLPKSSRPTVPYLYKYSNPDHLEWLKPIILEHELYLPTRAQLNDDFDSLPKLTLQSADEMILFILQRKVMADPTVPFEVLDGDEKILRFNIGKHGTAAYQPGLVESIDKQLDEFRIYSMTKHYDKMSLWAYYASNHTGYCLEFLNEGPLFEHAREVSYLAREDMDILITDPAIKNGDFFFCKTLEWRNEEEVRLVLPRNKGFKVKMNDRRWLNRIILGKDMKDEHRELIKGWAKQRQPELPVVRTYIDRVERAIIIRE
jgi:hypothetical protein